MSADLSLRGRTIDWGRTPYRLAWQRQDALVGQRIAGEVADTLVLTEHDPVFTLGLRAGGGRHLLWDEARLAREGIELVQSNRGGDITYHGPGQVVGYPIISLAHPRDLHAYLRFLEGVLIAALDTFGLAAARREGKTGLWLGRRKIAALGVAVRRWVTYHGFALNVNPNLGHFRGIVPCGIAAEEGEVTSMAVELGRPVAGETVKSAIATAFWAQLPALVSPAVAAAGHAPRENQATDTAGR